MGLALWSGRRRRARRASELRGSRWRPFWARCGSQEDRPLVCTRACMHTTHAHACMCAYHSCGACMHPTRVHACMYASHSCARVHVCIPLVWCMYAYHSCARVHVCIPLVCTRACVHTTRVVHVCIPLVRTRGACAYEDPTRARVHVHPRGRPRMPHPSMLSCGPEDAHVHIVSTLSCGPVLTSSLRPSGRSYRIATASYTRLCSSLSTCGSGVGSGVC